MRGEYPERMPPQPYRRSHPSSRHHYGSPRLRAGVLPVAAGDRPEALDRHDEHRVSAVHERAIDNLRYIRRTMESAGSFTAIPGWGQVVMGTTALIAAALAWHQTRVEWWLATWLGEAVLSLLVGAWAVGRKAQATGIPLLAGPSRRFAFCFLPPMAAAVVLTFAIYR